jgi:hypothetical protein
MKKMTKTTFKNFIKKNAGNLFIQCAGSFDGMSDCVEFVPANKRKFVELKKKTISDMDYRIAEERGTSREQLEDCIFNSPNTLGYIGIWLVDSSRNWFQAYEDDQFQGISVDNCCGSFIVAIRKQSNQIAA